MNPRSLRFALALAVVSVVQGATDTATTTLNVTIPAEASISVTASPTLTASGTAFDSFTGTTTFSYLVRTDESAGSGSITAQVTSDFSGAGAPDADVNLSYTCGGTGAGTACSGTQQASTSSATSVRTFGADAHSATGGDAGSILWTLENKPTYKTGSYSATVTLTISAS